MKIIVITQDGLNKAEIYAGEYATKLTKKDFGMIYDNYMIGSAGDRQVVILTEKQWAILAGHFKELMQAWSISSPLLLSALEFIASSCLTSGENTLKENK